MENQLDFYQTQLQSATQSRGKSKDREMGTKRHSIHLMLSNIDEISEELMAMALEMDKL